MSCDCKSDRNDRRLVKYLHHWIDVWTPKNDESWQHPDDRKADKKRVKAAKRLLEFFE